MEAFDEPDAYEGDLLSCVATFPRRLSSGTDMMGASVTGGRTSCDASATARFPREESTGERRDAEAAGTPPGLSACLLERSATHERRRGDERLAVGKVGQSARRGGGRGELRGNEAFSSVVA